jgi:hypothetical protein
MLCVSDRHQVDFEAAPHIFELKNAILYHIVYYS